MGQRTRDERRRAAESKRARRRWALVAGALAVGAVALWAARSGDDPAPAPPTTTAPVVRPTIEAEYPHDPRAFTQGLLIADGALYESTGLYGASSLRRVDLETGRVLDSLSVGEEYFAEGLAALGGRLYQLTWREGAVFVYDQATLAPLDTLAIPGEGWGLAEMDGQLVLSDGTDRLRWLDPATLAPVREVRVRDGDRPVGQLNELEVVGGRVYANVWQTGRIAVIDPADGAVVQWIDLSDLAASQRAQGRDVLNGIAFDPGSGRLLVTGKLWPSLYAVALPDVP